nr:unnamed protein product [Spirometra erinaceieuropaei]
MVGRWNTASAPSLRGSVRYAAGQTVVGTLLRHRGDEAPPDPPLVSRRDGSPHRHRRDAPTYAVEHRRLTATSHSSRRRQTGRVSLLTLAAWNVRSLLDNPRSNRQDQRTALVVRELARYKVDIATLSETRFCEQGQLDYFGAGYTFFWSGRPRTERRDAGVAFAIWKDIVGQLPCQ